MALAKLGHANDRVIVLDGDTKNSTFSDIFKREHPERFIECFIAEQNMVRVLWVSLLGLLTDSACWAQESSPVLWFFFPLTKAKELEKKMSLRKQVESSRAICGVLYGTTRKGTVDRTISRCTKGSRPRVPAMTPRL